VPHQLASHSGFRPARTLGVLLAVATALLITVPSAGQADPTSITDVQKKIGELYHDAEVATEQYNGYQDRMRAAERELKVTQERVGEQQNQLDKLLTENGIFATMAYRSGGVDQTLQLFLSDDPQQFLEQATMLDQLSAQQADALRRVEMARQDLLTIRAQATRQIGEIEQLQIAMTEKRDAIEASMRKANALLATLKLEQRAFLRSTGSLLRSDPRCLSSRGCHPAQGRGRASSGRRLGLQVPPAARRSGLLLQPDQPRRHLHRRGAHDPCPTPR
jgi:hypothetical protein